MPHTVFSEAWVAASAEEIRASEEYRVAASRWEWSLLLVLRADPELGLPDDRFVYLDLFHGECRVARLGTAADADRADFVLGAGPRAWREILDGRLDPIAGIMRRQLHLEKGSMTTLAMHAAGAKALVAAAGRVGARFPAMTPEVEEAP
ncbi:MAG: SCP2 sterol-binding domain-containing protein [Gemmatimonadetes bacterium]|nr:SCP2 sterol-binding domain-containing protein [Gemmatimonadota bacterium]